MKWKNYKKYKDIDPDEIFLDSRNSLRFDTHQLEGRIEKPLGKRAIYGLYALLFVVLGIFLGKLFILQVADADSYKRMSENNHLRHETIFADRGIVYDRNGIELIWNEPNPNDEYSLRKYNKNSGLAHVLGYVSYPQKDNKGYFYETEYSGKFGVEQIFSDTISGVNGIKITEKDVSDNIVSESSVLESKTGEDLILSIDMRVEHNLYEYIKDLAMKVGFRGGAGIIMDVQTGEIIALTSYPEFSVQVLTDGSDAEKIREYTESESNPFLNRVTNGLYTPGSIVKPFVAIAALNENIITPKTTIVSTGSIRIRNPYDPNAWSVFTDWKAHGAVTVRDAISVSSNVFFYEVGGGFEKQKGLGIRKLVEYLEAFGISKRTGIYGIDESRGVIPTPEWKSENFDGDAWRIGDTYNTSIGQYGFQVTPIQMVRAVSAIANGGMLVTPRLTVNGRPEARKIAIPIEEEYFRVAREGMRQSVTGGISSGLNLQSVKVAAKTGTAELGSRKQFVNSWVNGFFPYDNPRYAFAVVMERGPSTNLMGALFVMRNLLEWMSIEVPEYLR